MFLVGLTGGIATGKSTVSSMFTALGVQVIDADLMARRVVEPGRRASKRIRETFGDEVFNSDGTLNRTALGNIIFQDAGKRKQLNQITHPEIFREICWELMFSFIKGYKFVILDLPLLYESGMWAKYLECVIVVSCEENLQVQRLIQRSQLSENDAITRINAQMSLSEKRERADYVIDNSGDLRDTEQQVKQIYECLVESNAYLKIRISALVAIVIVVGGVTLAVKSLVYGNWF